jgi:RimJ/RimL family protein N-acetyltransferase
LKDIDWINSTAEINVILYAKNCWGRGYGYDTVRTLTNYGMYEMNINVLFVKILEGNERAIKCFQKAGYEIEGVLYSRVFTESRFRNVVSMSIIKDNSQEG